MSNKGKKAKSQCRATLNLRRLSEAEYRDLWHGNPPKESKPKESKDEVQG